MIGIFNDSFPPAIDGVGIGQYYTALELHNLGREVCVVTTKAEGEPYEEPFIVDRLPTILLRQRKPYGLGVTRFPNPVLSRVRRREYDLIHAHSPFSVGVLGREIARKQGVPFIATFHSKYWDDIYDATKSERIADKMNEKLMDFFASTDQLWIGDESIKKTLAEYGYHGEVEIIPIGIDTAGMKNPKDARERVRAEMGLAVEQPLFLYVGQHIDAKNIDLILESLALLDDLPFHLITCGDGKARERLEEKASKLGIADKVTFMGLVSDRYELMSNYAAADLFLFPSFYDTFGTVIREAAAMHTPSLLVEGSTCSSFVRHGSNGFIGPNTPEGYAQAIREIIGDREWLQDVSDHVSEHLGQPWEEVVKIIDTRYQTLIENNKR